MTMIDYNDCKGMHSMTMQPVGQKKCLSYQQKVIGKVVCDDCDYVKSQMPVKQISIFDFINIRGGRC